MIKRPKIKVGDIYEIRLSNGRLAYAQYLQHNQLGYLIRVFDCVREEPVGNVVELRAAGNLFPPVFVGLLATVRSGRWKLIGNLPVEKFSFREHHDDCRRFSYLGEWHSHPSFEVLPSSSDLASMNELVCDPSVGANFAILLIVRLKFSKELQASATLCQPSEQFLPARLYIESIRPIAQRRFRFL